jgi:hypothetical protein
MFLNFLDLNKQDAWRDTIFCSFSCELTMISLIIYPYLFSDDDAIYPSLIIHGDYWGVSKGPVRYQVYNWKKPAVPRTVANLGFHARVVQ